MISQTLKTMGVIAAVATLTACSAKLDPLSADQQRAERVQQLQALFDSQEAVSAPLSLSDAIARALKYNTDQRVAMMEIALATADVSVANMDMLPQMTVNAGYVDRSNVNASSRESVETGLPSLEPSTSQESARSVADAELVWNILDFGISYVSAKQQKDRVLIQQEIRRKVIQNIVQEVRTAYWNAYNAQQLGDNLNALMKDVDAALLESKFIIHRDIQAPLPVLQVEDTLLSVKYELNNIREEFVIAGSELSRLMNLKPGMEFTLQPSSLERQLASVNKAPADLEQLALVSRPELRQEDYQLRIDKAEVRKSMLRMLPGIELQAGVLYDSNKFFLHNSWSIGGIRLTWNLLNLFQGPAYKRLARTNVEIDDMRRLAVSMAVLTQLHVAFLRYGLAQGMYEIAENQEHVSGRISSQVSVMQEAGKSNAYQAIEARSKGILARLRKAQAFSELQNAVARIQNSIGMDPIPATVSSHELNTLSLAISDHQQKLGVALYDADKQEVVPEAGPKTYPLKE
jgi:outer membrane protein TolC